MAHRVFLTIYCNWKAIVNNLFQEFVTWFVQLQTNKIQGLFKDKN